MRNLESRIANLEQAAKGGDVCYVARELLDGQLVPSRPGAKLAPFYAVLPEVLEIEEWARKYAPA